MASQDKKLGAPAEFELRDDDRPSATGYGYISDPPVPSHSLASECSWSDGFSDTSIMTAIRTEAGTSAAPSTLVLLKLGCRSGQRAFPRGRYARKLRRASGAMRHYHQRALRAFGRRPGT